jgi:Na+/melibiose symporter-like transporter
LPPLTWRDYVSGLFIAYLIPWLAVFIQAILSWRYWGDYPLPFRRILVFSDFSILLWMMIPAAISFLILWPFLRYRIGRRVAVVVICLAWMYLEAANHVTIHYIRDVV